MAKLPNYRALWFPRNLHALLLISWEIDIQTLEGMIDSQMHTVAFYLTMTTLKELLLDHKHFYCDTKEVDYCGPQNAVPIMRATCIVVKNDVFYIQLI